MSSPIEKNVKSYTMQLGGRPLTVETGKVAKQAGGAVTVRYGDTMILATATASQGPREGIDFFPLTVDVEERLYAVGRIPGSWGRREGRPPEKAILAARLTDRPIRPLFPEGFRNDVQIVVTILSVDHDCSPTIAGMIGASCALCISDIPFGGPIGAVEVGLVDGELVINPDSAQSQKSLMSLTVAGTSDAVMMVEAGAKEVPEEQMLEAVIFGHDVIKELVAFQNSIAADAGKPKRQMVVYEPDKAVEALVTALIGDKLAIAAKIPEKKAREDAIDALQAEVLALALKEYSDKAGDIKNIFHDALKKVVRAMITNEGIRPDGRKPDEIRPIWTEVSVLPRTHGSAIFTRGQTQVMSITTLGASGDVQELDTIGEETTKRYMHHYNFPSFSTGETKPLRGPGRREIGHGALAERALLAVVPHEDQFPYTIRVVSEVLESNGSTSMASVCGSTMSLMDAGVPLKAPVAGVAMGLIKEGEKFQVLTDIQGMEDFLGDMDFKVAGTREGVTALQMDMKIKGINRDILSIALTQAKAGRLFILGRMLETIDSPRPELSPYAPRIIVIEIDPDKIRDVIGPGGKMINKIIAATNTKIDIENSGKVMIASVDEDGGRKAVKMIEALTKDVQVGETYMGTVTRLADFGVFVELVPGKEGLVRKEMLAEGFVNRVEDVTKLGETFEVKVNEIDRLGRINLVRPGIDKKPEFGGSRDGGGSRGRFPSHRDGPGGGPRRDGPSGGFRDRNK